MRFALPAFFVLAIANGLFADIAYAVAAGTGRLPFSPVIIIIILAAARLLMLGQPSGGPFPVLAMGVLAAGALVPSSLASWLGIVGISAAGTLWDRGRRAAYQMMLALAMTQIWHGTAFKIFASTFTSGEAVLLASCLRLLGFTPEVDGNVVRVTADHALVLLSGCSVFAGLGVVLLGWSAVFCLLRADERFPARYLSVVVLTAIALNIVRLILMAYGAEWHEVVHDGIGAPIYDAIVCLLVISAAWLPAYQASAAVAIPARKARKAAAVTTKHTWTGREALVCVALTAAMCVSLAVKSVRYSSTDATGWHDATDRIKGEVQARGFTFVGMVAVTADQAIEGMAFTKPDCEGTLLIAMMGASSDTLPMIMRYMSGTHIAVYLDGTAVENSAVPRFLAVNIAEIAMSAVRGSKPVLHPLIAVSRPLKNETSACQWPGLTP